jgi:hypothetical protein
VWSASPVLSGHASWPLMFLPLDGEAQTLKVGVITFFRTLFQASDFQDTKSPESFPLSQLSALFTKLALVDRGVDVNHGTLGWNLYNYADRITSNIIARSKGRYRAKAPIAST